MLVTRFLENNYIGEVYDKLVGWFILTEANKSNETVKNLAPEMLIAFWHCWQTICTKVFASSDPSYHWQEYAASITDELWNVFNYQTLTQRDTVLKVLSVISLR